MASFTIPSTNPSSWAIIGLGIYWAALLSFLTSNNKTQNIVSESLDKLQATRIVIAHRLSTIKNADRIYVMDKGQIVEGGTYEELMKLDGLFSQLAKRQIA